MESNITFQRMSSCVASTTEQAKLRLAGGGPEIPPSGVVVAHFRLVPGVNIFSLKSASIATAQCGN